MKPDILHRFLHAINFGELACCKKAIAADTSKWAPQRKVLFDTLMHQQTYDADKLSKVFGDSPYGKELSLEKTKMLKRMMHTVNEHRAGHEDNRNPMEKLRESQLLFSLGLREEAIATAEEGIKRALRMAEPLAETCLRDHLRQVLKMMHDDRPRIADNEEQLLRAARQVANLMECHVAADRVGLHNARFRTPETDGASQEWERLMAQPILSNADNALSMPAKLRYLSAWSMYYGATGKWDENAELLQQQVALWQQHPERIAHLPHVYLSTLSSLTGLLIRLGTMADVPALLQRMADVPTTTVKDKVAAFYSLELNHQLYYMNTGNCAAAVGREALVMEKLEEFSTMMPDSYRIALYYNIGIAHLMLGNNRRALVMFKGICDLGHCFDRLDLQGLARLFRMLILLERYPLQGIDHYLRNSRRFFKADHASYPMEKAMHNWMVEGGQHPEEALSKVRLLYLHHLLAPMNKQNVIGADELQKWALSRANRIPMLGGMDAT